MMAIKYIRRDVTRVTGEWKYFERKLKADYKIIHTIAGLLNHHES